MCLWFERSRFPSVIEKNLKLLAVFVVWFHPQLSFRFFLWWKNHLIVWLTLFLVVRIGGSRCVFLGCGKFLHFSSLMKLTRWRWSWLITRVPSFMLLLENNCYKSSRRSCWKGRFTRCNRIRIWTWLGDCFAGCVLLGLYSKMVSFFILVAHVYLVDELLCVLIWNWRYAHRLRFNLEQFLN